MAYLHNHWQEALASCQQLVKDFSFLLNRHLHRAVECPHTTAMAISREWPKWASRRILSMMLLMILSHSTFNERWIMSSFYREKFVVYRKVITEWGWKAERELIPRYTVPVKSCRNWGWSNQQICSPSEVRELTYVVDALIFECYALCSRGELPFGWHSDLRRRHGVRPVVCGIGMFLLILCPWRSIAYWRVCITGVRTVLCCWKETYKSCK